MYRYAYGRGFRYICIDICISIRIGMCLIQVLKDLYPPMPVVHLTAIPKEQAVLTGFYVCPVYTTGIHMC